MRHNVRLWNGAPLAGYVVTASAGESLHLSEAEQDQVVGATRQAIEDDRLLIVGMMTFSAAVTSQRVRRVADCGADAAMLTAPFFYDKYMSSEALYRYFQTVANESPIPILLYYRPSTGIQLTVGDIVRLSSIPGIIGLKDSSGDIGFLNSYIDLVPPGFAVLTGSFPLLCQALRAGARGGVVDMANLLPRTCTSIFDAARQGDWDRAQEIHRPVHRLHRQVVQLARLAGIKAAMDLWGYRAGPPRLPMLDITDDDRQVLVQILAAAGQEFVESDVIRPVQT
jgi:4-hydroxy-2-oxoglutarate aldolase